MKKVLALALASAMALGMAATAFAVDITGMTGNGLADGYGTTRQSVGGSTLGTAPAGILKPSKNGQTVTYGATIRPADEVKDYVNLFSDMFNGLAAGPDHLLTASEIRANKITVRQSVAQGSKAIDSVKIDNKKGRIEIKYIKEWVNTGDFDVDFTVYILIDGKRQDDDGITFIGNMENEITPVYEDTDYVDLSKGQVAEANDFAKNVEVDLGNGISIFTKMFKDKKYYGTASRDDDEKADVVYAKYPDVDNVVILKTVGLNSTGDIVKMSTDYDSYYVYDADMNYLGQSSDMLPYSTRYYLANKKLDIVNDDDAGEEPEDDGEDDGENPNMGGDDVADNANANPGTGR